MDKTSVRIPGIMVFDISQEVKKNRFKDQSDFIRQAIKYLLSDLKKYPDLTLKRLEELSK